MSARSGDDPRSLSPGPAAAQADDGGLTMGLHRQTAHVDDPGVKTHDRLHGVGPSRLPVDGFKRERHVDIRVENCTGLLKNGNCAGDPYWMPPDGAWYTWPGIGGTPPNRLEHRPRRLERATAHGLCGYVRRRIDGHETA